MFLVKETPTKDSSSKFPRFLFLYTKNKYKMSDRIKRVSLFMARNRWAVSTNRKLSKVWTIDFRILKKRRFQCVLIHLAEKKRITFSVRKSREFSPIFPNIVNNSRGRRKFSFYLELEIHRCAWYASFCSVIVHRSNYRSSLIKSLSLSLRNNCRPSLRKYLRK